MDDFKDEMKLKEVYITQPNTKLLLQPYLLLQNELKNIEDACDELELADDEGGKIPYLIGEVFVYQDVENTQVTYFKCLLLENIHDVCVCLEFIGSCKICETKRNR